MCVCVLCAKHGTKYYDIKAKKKKKNPCLSEVYVANGEHKLCRHAGIFNLS